MMTLDEAIKHCEEMAEKNEEMCRVEEVMGLGLQNTEMMKCARTYKQLAEWLKELKQLRQQEPCKDAICREDLKEPKFIIAENDYQKGWNDALDSVYENAPSIQQKKGRWIRRNNDYFDWYECSECGYGSDGEMKYNRLCDVRTNYCPDCGSQNIVGIVEKNKTKGIVEAEKWMQEAEE